MYRAHPRRETSKAVLAGALILGTLLASPTGVGAEDVAQPAPVAAERPVDGLILIDPSPLGISADGSLEVKLTCVGGQDCGGQVSISLAATPGAARTALSASSSFAVPLTQQATVQVPTGRRPSTLRGAVAGIVVQEQDLAGRLRVSMLTTSVAPR